MNRFHLYCIALALSAVAAANATTFRFDTDPFAGTPVLNVPGRQIVGGESFISFSTATDIFSLESTVFGAGTTVNFINAQASALPATGVNIVVLETFDNDNNPLTPFGAGNAADLIASQITTSAPGFFIYFNQGLDLPRLVYSTDLSSSNADLRILARMLNLNGANGRNALSTFTAANFEITTASEGSAVPEPGNFYLIAGAALIAASSFMMRRRRATA